MDRYLTYRDFPGEEGAIPILNSIVSAIPQTFSIILFLVWLLGAGGIYFTILKTTGRKRFWSTLTAMSFVCFLLSLVVAAMNTTIEYISGYWVGFYILMTVISWYMLSHYK